MLYRLAEISIHPPLAGRDIQGMDAQITMLISIHPPLAGRDILALLTAKVAELEISIHPPLAGRDEAEVCLGERVGISIHPPLAGRDLFSPQRLSVPMNFNPPAPCGAGPPACSPALDPGDFNPPAPCGAGPALMESGS